MMVILLSLVLSFVALSSGQICPPADVLFPCVCEEEFRPTIRCIGIQEDFNLKGIFDNASEYVRDGASFHTLEIRGTSLAEIVDGAIENLAFENIFISESPKLSYISPRAFNASRSVTYHLHLRALNSISDPLPGHEGIYDFIKSFPFLYSLALTETNVTSIPDNLFENMDFLGIVNLNYNRISRIGHNAFATGAHELEILGLVGNVISIEGLPVDAFAGIVSTGAEYYLMCNKLEFLEQNVFQPMLNRAAYVSLGRGGCEGEDGPDRYHCDERVDWICDEEEAYRPILDGYLCETESGVEDIWEYCAVRNRTLS